LGVQAIYLNVRHARALDPLVRPGAMAQISKPGAAILTLSRNLQADRMSGLASSAIRLRREFFARRAWRHHVRGGVRVFGAKSGDDLGDGPGRWHLRGKGKTAFSKRLRDDRNLLIHAAAQAQRAADFILSCTLSD
jgi:hypothetical protein